MDITVNGAAADKGEFQPVAVWFGKRRVNVKAVVDRWYGAGSNWWKLDTDDGMYVLAHDESTRQWELAAVPLAYDPVDGRNVRASTNAS